MSTPAQPHSTPASTERAAVASGAEQASREPSVSPPPTGLDDSGEAASVPPASPTDPRAGSTRAAGETEWSHRADAPGVTAPRDPIAVLVRNPRDKLSTLIVRGQGPGSGTDTVPPAGGHDQTSVRPASRRARGLKRPLGRRQTIALGDPRHALVRLVFWLAAGFAVGLLATAAAQTMKPWLVGAVQDPQAMPPSAPFTLQGEVATVNGDPHDALGESSPPRAQQSGKADPPSSTRVSLGKAASGVASSSGGRRDSRGSGGTASASYRRLRRSMLREYRAGRLRSVVRLGRALRRDATLDLEALYVLAQSQRRLGLGSESVATYRELTEAYPGSRYANAALYWAARGEQALGNLEEAQTIYRRVAASSRGRWRRLAVRQLADMPWTQAPPESSSGPGAVSTRPAEPHAPLP